MHNPHPSPPSAAYLRPLEDRHQGGQHERAPAQQGEQQVAHGVVFFEDGQDKLVPELGVISWGSAQGGVFACVHEMCMCMCVCVLTCS